MIELTDHVERAVRPVRARPARKRRMQQELLGHLTAAYDEERARLGDDQLALNLALTRFGVPADLTRELQASVPWWERVLYARASGPVWLERWQKQFRITPDQPSLRNMVWLSALFAVYAFILLMVMPLILVAGGKAWPDARIAAGALGLITLHAFVSMFLCLGFSRAVMDRLRPVSVLRIVGYGTAVVLSGLAFVAGMNVVQSDNPLWGFILTPSRILGMATGGALMLLVLAVAVRIVGVGECRAAVYVLPAGE